MHVIYTTAAALVGALIFERLRVPAGPMIGAMVAVAGMQLLRVETFELPGIGRFAAFAAIGWLIGQSVNRSLMHELQVALVPIVLSIAALLFAGAVLALVLVVVTGLDWSSALLATSPGGLSQMAALAVDMRGNVGIVMAFHTLRVIAVLVTAPLLVYFAQPS